MSANHITLESVSLEFNKWREKRKGSENIPEKLWKMVADIYYHYPHTLICQQLNLKAAQLKRRGLEPSGDELPIENETKVEMASHFVHVPATVNDSLPAAPYSEIPCVEIHRPDGVRILFKHHDNSQLSAVLQQLIGA